MFVTKLEHQHADSFESFPLRFYWLFQYLYIMYTLTAVDLWTR